MLLFNKNIFFLFLIHPSPTPHLTWRRIDRGSIFRGVTENFGKVLKIEQVTRDDEGTYECVASNDLGETKHEFKVGVEGRFNYPKMTVLGKLCVCVYVC